MRVTDFAFNDGLRRDITANLAAFERRGIDDDTLRRAAVLIVIVAGEDGSEAGVLLTKRPDSLRRHGGQYALPGGRLDEGETPVQAGLREMAEELGVTLDPGDILGTLDDCPTRSGFRITPIVIWGADAVDLTPDPVEVARVFPVPLSQLDSPEIPRLEMTPESEHPVLSAPLPILGHDLFAPTASILYQFREAALRGEPTRVAHYDQPTFAWK